MKNGAHCIIQDSSKQVQEVITDQQKKHTDKPLNTGRQNHKSSNGQAGSAHLEKTKNSLKVPNHAMGTKKLRTEMLLHPRPQALYCRQD